MNTFRRKILRTTFQIRCLSFNRHYHDDQCYKKYDLKDAKEALKLWDNEFPTKNETTLPNTKKIKRQIQDKNDSTHPIIYKYLLLDKNQQLNDITILFTRLHNSIYYQSYPDIDPYLIDIQDLIRRIEIGELDKLKRNYELLEYGESMEDDFIDLGPPRLLDRYPRFNDFERNLDISFNQIQYQSKLLNSIPIGSWHCHFCQSINYHRRTSCYHCNQSKLNSTPLIIKLNYTNKDWICLKCFTYNLKNRRFCIGCKRTRTRFKDFFYP